MKIFSPRNRIALGLTGAVVAVICIARIAGFLPDQESALVQARADLSESIALGSSSLLMNGNLSGLDAFLHGVVDRNANLESAGVRDQRGCLTIEVGDHQGHWLPLDDDQSNDAQMQVPIYKTANEKWGSVELRFRPARAPGILGVAQAMNVGLTFFVGTSCFLIFSFVLRLVLKQLDPSKAVPQRVRDALDSLAEGLMILDMRFNVLLANTALARVLDREPEKLVGMSCQSLRFQLDSETTDVDDQSDTIMPWQTALSEHRTVSDARVHLKDATGKNAHLYGELLSANGAQGQRLRHHGHPR